MPTLSDMANLDRPVYERKDPEGNVVSRHRLKCVDDLSIVDQLTLDAAAKGFYRPPAEVLATVLYDPIPDPSATEAEEILALWVASLPKPEDEEDKADADLGELLPDLQYTYGTLAQPWETVPRWALTMYSDQTARLHAREALRWYRITAAGSGAAGKKGRSIVQEWRFEARGRRPATPPRKPSRAEHMALLAAIGIEFIEG